MINRGWDWVSALGTVGPDDAAGRRFRSMGAGSCIGFPAGATFGQHWIAIGDGTLICPHVTLAAGLPGEQLDREAKPIVTIGSRCIIGRGASIVGRMRIEIEDEVTTGPNVYVTDHNHVYADIDVPIGRQWLSEEPVRIGYGTWLGAAVVVLPGADIGRNVTVAANSVVRGVVPDHSVVAGAPARVVRTYRDGSGWDPPLRVAAVPAPEGWSAGYGQAAERNG